MLKVHTEFDSVGRQQGSKLNEVIHVDLKTEIHRHAEHNNLWIVTRRKSAYVVIQSAADDRLTLA